MTTARPSSPQAVLDALAARGELTSADIATAAGLGRSTVAKALAALEREGTVRRVPGGRDGRRRLADRWSARSSDTPTVSGAPAVDGSTGQRLQPGQLDGLVLGVLDADTPRGATAVAKALGRSSGAVGNCLTRLAAAGQIRQVGEQPRRYCAVAPGADVTTPTPRRGKP